MSEHDSGPGSETRENYAIILPVEQERFAEFISKLLGKTQRIERHFSGNFDISRQQIEDTYYLVNQRVLQQNEASLLQFTARIMYDDESSVLLNSFEDFRTYKEVRPLVSVGVHCSWTYLIRFPGRDVPEKQEIDLTVQCVTSRFTTFIPSSGSFLEPETGGSMHLAIAHTERTWGVDIESLLAGHLDTLFREEGRLVRLLCRHSGKVGFGAGALFFSLAMVGAVLTSNSFLDESMQIANSILGESVESQLAFLIERSASSSWVRFMFSLGFFVIAALVSSVFLGTWVGSAADNRTPSFLLLSKGAEDKKKSTLEQSRGWRKLVVSSVAGVAISVIGSFVFHILSKAWLE